MPGPYPPLPLLVARPLKKELFLRLSLDGFIFYRSVSLSVLTHYLYLCLPCLSVSLSLFNSLFPILSLSLFKHIFLSPHLSLSRALSISFSSLHSFSTSLFVALSFLLCVSICVLSLYQSPFLFSILFSFCVYL